MLKMKHFEKKIKQKINPDTPPENFIIKYTEISQNKNSAKKDMISMICSAVDSENREQRRHFATLPPSKSARGRRLKMLRADDARQNIIISSLRAADLKVRRDASIPVNGPAMAINISCG